MNSIASLGSAAQILPPDHHRDKICIYRRTGQPLSYGFREACSKILALLKRILLYPIELVKSCFATKKIVKICAKRPSVSHLPGTPEMPKSAGLHDQRALGALEFSPVFQLPSPCQRPALKPGIFPKPFIPSKPVVVANAQQAGRDPSSPPKPLEFKEFLGMIKHLDEEAKTPLATLFEEVEKLTTGELTDKMADYRQRLLEALNPDILKKREDYLSAIRQFLKSHPQSTLFPLVGLKDPESTPLYVPRLLASYESPVIGAAMQHQMCEGKKGIYCSPLFAEGNRDKIAKFVEDGELSFDHVGQAINLYETSHQLMMDNLWQACRQEVIRYAQNSMKSEDLIPLWSMAEHYEDHVLQFACIQYAAKCDLSELPVSLKTKAEVLRTLDPLLVSPSRIGKDLTLTASMSKLDSSLLASCAELGIHSVSILFAYSDESADELKRFKSLDLDYLPDKRNSDVQITRGIAHLMRDNPSIHNLNLRISKLGEDAAQEMMDALQSSHLTTFQLRYCQMEPCALPVMADFLAKNKTLTEVSFNSVNFDDKGLELLAKGLAENSTILTLSLKGNTFSEGAISSFKEALAHRLPKLKIEF